MSRSGRVSRRFSVNFSYRLSAQERACVRACGANGQVGNFLSRITSGSRRSITSPIRRQRFSVVFGRRPTAHPACVRGVLRLQRSVLTALPPPPAPGISLNCSLATVASALIGVRMATVFVYGHVKFVDVGPPILSPCSHFLLAEH